MQGRHKFLTNIENWENNVFNDLLLQKKGILAKLSGIQIALSNKNSDFLISLEKEILHSLNHIHSLEKRIWAQKAGVDWRKYGDYNTRYFHIVAKIKKSRVKILSLKDNHGIWIYEKRFLNLWPGIILPLSLTQNFNVSSRISSSISNNNLLGLSAPTSKEELKDINFSISRVKCPGSYGLSAHILLTFLE